MSGPVGGVAGAEAVAAQLGDAVDAVTLDIGGTSADVAVIDHGDAVHTPQAELARWPIMMPMVDIQSIGAGGGSIAYVDPHGRVHVGPESAGSAPGPACYRQGGTRPTVTDANLVLGRIDGARFLDGAMPLDVDAACAAIERGVAHPLDMSVNQAAEGVLRVVNSNMARLLRDVLIQRRLRPARVHAHRLRRRRRAARVRHRRRGRRAARRRAAPPRDAVGLRHLLRRRPSGPPGHVPAPGR